MVNYSNLVNKNGTIYNTAGPTPNTTPDGGYPTAEALQADLGTGPINWNNIPKNPNYQPVQPVKQPTSPAPTPTSQQTYGFMDKSSYDVSGNQIQAPTQGGTSPVLSVDPTYQTGIPQLDEIQNTLAAYLEKLLESGKTINPKIELTPTEVQSFLDQATNEISPYYKSQIDSMKNELSANIKYLKEQYDLKKQADEAQFKQELGTKRESLAGAGLTFSGVRGGQEQNMRSVQDLQLQSNALQASNAASQAAGKAAQAVGSRNISDLGLGGITAYSSNLEGSGAFSPSRTLDIYKPTSDVTGSVEYQQRGDIRSLSDFLKQQEVQKRTLAFGG